MGKMITSVVPAQITMSKRNVWHIPLAGATKL
jgi:hypothetical protein